MADVLDSNDNARHNLRPRDSHKRISAVVDCVDTIPNEKVYDMEEATAAAITTGSKRKHGENLITIHNSPKKPRTTKLSGTGGTDLPKFDNQLPDVYCWECHKECVESALDCVTCPRTFHLQCLQNYKVEIPSEVDSSWTCPVCINVVQAENPETRSWAMQRLNKEQFAVALEYALQRMKHQDSTAFHHPVPKNLIQDYYDVVFHPMDLETLEKNIKGYRYASTEAFLEEAKWILHDSVIYNGLSSKYTLDAKLIIKICKHEMSEIELCPDCYLKSCLRNDNWFAEPCTYPHCLVWAKLKGFPFWPAKALRVSAVNVDVRFFGAHDRAWIPLSQVYLLSEESPTPVKNVKKFRFDKAMEELQLHLERLRKVPNMEFQYAPSKTEFKSEYLESCPLLFGSQLVADRGRTMPTGDVSFLSDSALSKDNVRCRNTSNTSSITTSEGTVASDSAAQLRLKSPPTIILSRADDKTYNVRCKDTPAIVVKKTRPNDDKSEPDNNAINGICRAGNEAHPSPTGANCEEQPPVDECLSVFDKMELIMKENKKNHESVENTPAKQLRLPASYLSKKWNRNRTTTLSLKKNIHKNNGHIIKPICNGFSTASESHKSPEKRLPSQERRNVFLHARVRQTSRARLISSERSKTAQQSGNLKDVKKKTLQSVLARMSGQSVKPLSSSTIGSSSEDALNYSSDRNNSSSIALPSHPRTNSIVDENPQRTKGDTTGSNKSQLIEKYVRKFTDAFSNVLVNICHEMYEDVEDLCKGSGEQPCSSKEVLSAASGTKLADHAPLFYHEAVFAVKKTAETFFDEIKQASEIENDNVQQAGEETRKKLEDEKLQAIKETKQKQWCANCGKEAVFYCCWNTSYCDYPCQQLHWHKHQNTCAQIRHSGTANEHTQAQNRNIQATTFSPLPQATLQQLNIQQSMGNMAPQGASNVVPLYALPTAGYYKAAVSTNVVPATVTLDLNGTAVSGQQFVTIHQQQQPRPPGITAGVNRPPSTYVALRPRP